MNKVLIAVKSSQEDKARGCHDAIRETWGSRVDDLAKLIFFYGGLYCARPADDEIFVGAPDDYNSLPFKTRAIIGYAVDYDFVFIMDTDTYIIPSLLMKSGFEKYDYSGRFGLFPAPAIGTTFSYRDGRGIQHDACHPWASGMGYFLSRKAQDIVYRTEPKLWAEDMYVGDALGPHIQSGEITAADLPIEGQSMWHFPKRMYGGRSYDPGYGWMKVMDKKCGLAI